MKSVILVLFIGVFAMCGCGKIPSMRLDARTGEALKFALIDASNVIIDHGTNIDSVSNLVLILNEQGKLKRIEPYGVSNCFFNPNMQTWRAVATGNPQRTSLPAVVIRNKARQYSAVYFDGSLESTNQPPAEWCKP
jgi:hypothetical protein